MIRTSLSIHSERTRLQKNGKRGGLTCNRPVIISMLSPIKTRIPACYRSCAVSLESYRGHSGKKGYEGVSDPQARCKDGTMGRLVATLAHACRSMGIIHYYPQLHHCPLRDKYICMRSNVHAHTMHRQSRIHFPHT